MAKICKYCGKPVTYKDREFRGQASHTSCIRENSPDIVITIGDFSCHLYSELISNKKKTKRWWSQVGQLLMKRIEEGRLDVIDLMERKEKGKNSDV